MKKKRDKKEMKVWQMLVGAVIGVIVFCLPLLLPRSVPNGGKIALFLVGLGILAVVLLTLPASVEVCVARTAEHGGAAVTVVWELPNIPVREFSVVPAAAP